MVHPTRSKRNSHKATPNKSLRDFPLHDYSVRLKLPNGETVIAGGISDIAQPDGTYRRTFHKTIKPFHFLYSPRAIGLSTATVKYLRRAKVKELLVRHAELGIEYRVDLLEFLRLAFEQQRDADVQLFLTLDKWRIRHPQLEAETTPPAPQLGLFEGVPA